MARSRKQASEEPIAERDPEFEWNSGVEDDAIFEDSEAPLFTITSYGADYTVDSLVRRMRAESFVIPDFQRKYVWSPRHASKFIESLLMGLPVPGIFLYRQVEDNRHLVIDGHQRLTSLRAFYDGHFGDEEKPFMLTGIRAPWAGKTYAELDPADQLRLDDSIIHATIFHQDKPEEVLSSIYYVFERINSGGITLSPQEIRNGINQGPLLALIRELNKLEVWRRIFGKESNRLKDQELILRFFALLDNASNYARPMTTFLNNYASSHKNADAAELAALQEAFESTIQLVHKSIGDKSFRLARSLNAAVFDSVMVGLRRRLQNGKPAPKVEAVRDAYEALLALPDYRAACAKSTADEENVTTRLRLATGAFADL